MAYWLIETEEQLDYLNHLPIKEAFVEIIPYHDNIHPALNDVSLLYIKPFDSTKGYMLGIDHSETFSLSKTLINDVLNKIEKIWVRDKKSSLYYFQTKAFHDLSILAPTYIPPSTQAHNYLYSHNPTYTKINRIIPISKHYEKCETIYNQIIKLIPNKLPPYYDFYNTKAILAFLLIEKNGININKNEFNKHFHPTQEFYSIDKSTIYSQYNLATTTHRPSNSFNSINFAALKKDDKSRESFTADFIEFDISAYHPHLVGWLVSYDFANQDIHQTFAELYNTDYKTSKEITFKQLYGGILKEYEHLEFFQKVKSFINNNWIKFNQEGEITVPYSGYIFEKNKLENMNPQKLFNYVLQNLESAVNVCILMDIHKLLRAKNTKIVLYTYDSFLFQMGEDEEYLVEQIRQIFSRWKLSVKLKKGINYHNMENI